MECCKSKKLFRGRTWSRRQVSITEIIAATRGTRFSATPDSAASSWALSKAIPGYVVSSVPTHRFLAKTACPVTTPDKMIPFVDIRKVPSPIHAGFRGIGQGKLSTKGRLTSLRFSEVIDGLELGQFFLCLITDRLQMIDDGEGCPGFHA